MQSIGEDEVTDFTFSVKKCRAPSKYKYSYNFVDLFKQHHNHLKLSLDMVGMDACASISILRLSKACRCVAQSLPLC